MPVGDERGGAPRLPEQVLTRRDDRCHTGAHAALDDGRVADAHAVDIGDRVVRARRVGSESEAELTSTHAQRA